MAATNILQKARPFFRLFFFFSPSKCATSGLHESKGIKLRIGSGSDEMRDIAFFSNELLGNAGSHHSFTSGFTSTLKAKRVYTLYPIGNFKLPFNQSPEHFYRSLAYISYKHCLSRQKAD